jgi:N-methylhydantoinase B
MTPEIDPIRFEVIKSALDAIADEMGVVIVRSAHSPIIRDALDFSTAVMDHQGSMLAQAKLTPGHMGSFPHAMQALIEEYGDGMHPGDVFITNDPYGGGGMHLPDIYVIKPVIFKGQVEGYVTTLCHHNDVGGISPGSNAVFAKEIYQEGLRIPLVRLYDAGKPDATVFKFIEKNVRIPVDVRGDLQSQVGACRSAEKQLLEMLEKYGATTMRLYTNEMLDLTERVMRDVIRDIPDGTYENTDFIDGFGEDPEPIVFKVKITVEGDELTADWTGTSPQVKAAINAPVPWTYSHTYIALRCLVEVDIPSAEGYMRPIKVIAPAGSIVNPDLPGAANARGMTGGRMLEVLFGALEKAVPGRCLAAGGSEPGSFGFGGVHDGEPFVCRVGLWGSWGGRSNYDGVDGLSWLSGNQSNQPIELIESNNPVEIRRYGYVPDSGGPGKNRGGLALMVEYGLLAEEAEFTARSDRRFHLPYGLKGGKSGTPSWLILNPDRPDQRVLPVLQTEALEMRKGEAVMYIKEGSGGYGDPLERDPSLVLEEVLDEKFTVEYVKVEYGVVIDPISRTLDSEATEVLRRRMTTTSGGRSHAESHVEHFVRSLGLDPRLRHRTETL